MLVEKIGGASLRSGVRVAIVVALFGSFIPQLSMAGGGTPVTGEFNAAEAAATSYYQSRHQVAVDAVGNSIVVWENNATGTHDGWVIKGRCFDPAGFPKANSFQISASSSSAQRLPAVGMSRTGEFMVAWEDFNGSSNDQGHQIVARRFTSACDTASAGTQFAVHVPVASTDEIHAPSVAMTAGGDTWIFSSQNLVAVGAKYSAFLTLPSATVTETQFGYHYSPVVAVDKAGNVALAFASQNIVTSAYEIYAQGFDLNGNAFTDPASSAAVTVNTTTAGMQDAPAISMNASGQLVIAWESDQVGKEVQAQLFQIGQTAPQTFAPVGSEITAVAAASSHLQAAPSAAIDYAGNFWLAWQDVDSSGPGIVARWYSASSSSFPSAAARVNVTTANAQVLPTIAADTDGDLLAAWINQGAEGASSAVDDVLLRQFSGHESVDLSISGSDSPTPAVAGSGLAYTLIVNNLHALTQNAGVNDTSIGTASGIYLTDTLPNNVSYSGFSGAGWSCAQTLQVINCTYAPALLPATNTSVTINVVPAAATIGTNITNVVSVGGNQYDASTSNNTLSDSQAVVADTDPNAFSFTGNNIAELGSQQTSNAVTISGINGAAPISVSGAAGSQYQINGGAWTSTAGNVNNGNTVAVRHTASSLHSMSTTTTLTIGTVSGSFTSKTIPYNTNPTNLVAVPGVGKVNLTWSSADGATTYRIYMGTTPGGEGATPVSSSNGNTGVVSGLTNGTYYFIVKAYNGTSFSSASNEANAVLGGPSAPANVVATPGNGRVTLTWTASPNAVTYRVYSGASQGAEGATAVTSSNGTSALVTGLTNGSTYYFIVKAFDNLGNPSPASSEVSAALVAVPPAPSNVVATPGNGLVYLSWGASGGATTYRIYLGSASGAEGTTPAASSNGTTGVVSGLANGNTYYLTVKAYNSVGFSVASNEVSITLPGAPQAPTNVSAIPGNGVVYLSWSPSAGATTYRIYVGPASGAEGTTPVASSNGTTGAVPGLINGNTYYFTVKAYNSAGFSPVSVEVSATPN